MNGCDILIPVYNAYDAVKACINSVLAKTELGEKTKLIIIDDKSSDERIMNLLEDFKKNNPKKIVFLKNKMNMGFVQTVNKGMQSTKKDVLILNSDTEVTENWLEKIRKCAYSDSMIATVTPLASFASLASVPRIFMQNEIPDGYSLDEMGKMVEKCSMRLYPEVPSAHGFCMYIKRAAIDKVGLFDEETFGRGYGEENDFCFRCFKYGYRHALCDDTYILHKGAESFGEKSHHNNELEIKHPEVWSKIDEWNNRRDIDKIGANIALGLSVAEERPNILVLAEKEEQLFHDGSIDAIDALREKCNFHILTVKDNYYEMHSFFKEYDLITGVFEKSMTVEAVRFYSNEYKQMIEGIIKDYGISLIYLASMKEQCFDVVTVCKEKRINLVTCPDETKYELDDEIRKRVDANAWQSEVQNLLCVGKKCIEFKKSFLKYSSIKKIEYETLRKKLLHAYMINNILKGKNEGGENGNRGKFYRLFRRFLLEL